MSGEHCPPSCCDGCDEMPCCKCCERLGIAPGSIRPLIDPPASPADACPRCGEVDLTKPCLGSESTKDGVRRPLPYRHSGRKPDPRIQPRLDGPALTGLGQWDTEALRPERP